MKDVLSTVEEIRGESYYANIINYIPHLIYGRDVDGRYTVVNRAFADFAGLEPHEIIGKTDIELEIFLNPEQVKDTDDVLFETKQKKFVPLEPFTDKFGNLYWFQTMKTPVFNQEKEVTEVLIVSTDVTNKVETEQKLTKSELRYRSIFESNYSGIIVVDKQLNILNKNKAFEGLVDGSHSSGYDLKAYLSEADRRDLLDLLNGLSTRNYEFFDIDLRLKTEQDRLKSTICFVSGLYDTNNNFTEAVITFQDVTDIQIKKKELEESELRFRTVVEHATEALLLLDYDNKRYIEANPSAIELFGYSRAELLGLELGELSPKEQEEGVNSLQLSQEYMNRAVNGESVVYEWIVKRKDGELLYCEVRLVKMPYPDRTIVRTSVVDITVRKKAEELLNQEKQKLQDSNKELISLNYKLGNQTKQLQEFAYIASHNLRSPAGNIKALLDFYYSDRTEANLEILLEKLDVVADDLMETINDLADVVKIKNEISKDTSKILLNKVVEKTLESLSQKINSTNAKFNIDFGSNKVIYAAKSYIESIFLNLVSNALKYSDPERSPEISITAFQEGNQLHIRVKDNGLGIDLEKYGSKIFGLRKTFHRHTDSRGVGLFITKAQVEALGGEISVKSKVDEGTEFTISLPSEILNKEK
ncbi:MAG: PAS domain-containing sensor histidine kinase [Bacteroidia bacterium]